MSLLDGLRQRGDVDGVLVVGEAGLGESEDGVGVFLEYVGGRKRALIDRELYVPVAVLSDPIRRRDVGIPEGLRFASKADYVKRMIERALGSGVPFGWVRAGEDYGRAKHVQAWLAERGLSYVLAVDVDYAVSIRDGGVMAVKDLVALVPEYAWYRRAGERLFAWAKVSVSSPENGRGRWVLARRWKSESDITAFICHGPEATSLQKLIEVASAGASAVLPAR